MNPVIDIMAKKVADWLSMDGKYSDVVISSRVRLARNLQNYLFVNRASEREQQEVITEVLQAAEETTRLKQTYYFDMSSVDTDEHQFFIERRLISLDFSEKSNPRGLLVATDESTDIMINEEDHLRIQFLSAGFSLKKGWQEIYRLDEELSKNLNYAFSDQFGYLTACPTNVGTGVRFSVFIHLPALTYTREIDEVFAELIPTGIAVRGFYGEGSQITGNFFQISNQYTLGWTEQEILDRLVPIVKKFINKEKKARQKIKNKQMIFIEDKVNRVVGILMKAKMISSMEFLDFVSTLRLGVALGITQQWNYQILNELMLICQPAHLQKISGENLTETERDMKRASLVRERLYLN